jgi:hypothetical protein
MPPEIPSYVERIDLPSGLTVWYIDEHPTDPKQNHSYWRHNPKTDRKGKRLAGVTTVVKPLDFKPDALMKWAAEKQCEGIAMLYMESEGEEFLHWLSNATAIWRELNDHGLTYDRIKERKGEEGTNVHVLAFQALAMGRPVPDFEKLQGAELAKAQAVAEFFLDHSPKALQVEQVVYSERLGVAGRLDFRGTLGARCSNPICACHLIEDLSEPGVADLKTGGFISSAAHAQAGGGYPLLAEESGFGESKWAAILQVFDDGTYAFFKAQAGPEDFELALATYRTAGRINNAAKKVREATRTRRQTDQQIAAMVGTGV